MVPFSDWFPLTLVGGVFTLLGLVKLFGLRRGIIGGREKPFLQKLCGT
jgi:hypothetical protein